MSFYNTDWCADSPFRLSVDPNAVSLAHVAPAYCRLSLPVLRRNVTKKILSGPRGDRKPFLQCNPGDLPTRHVSDQTACGPALGILRIAADRGLGWGARRDVLEPATDAS